MIGFTLMVVGAIALFIPSGGTYGTIDAYDELAESQKYVNGKRVKTTYQRDVFENQIENSSSEGKKVFTYNDKNLVDFQKQGIMKKMYK